MGRAQDALSLAEAIMRSATFRNIALGTLALAAAYHLGARTATGQSGPVVETAGIFGPQGNGVLAVSGRVVYKGDLNGQSGAALPPIPGSSRVVAVSWALFDTWLALLEDGDYYQCNREGTTWTRIGNVFSGPT